MICEWCQTEFVFRSKTMKKTRKFCTSVCQGLALRRSPQQKFDRYVRKTDGCWWWEGAKFAATGYGVFNIGAPHYRTTTAHRVSYELHTGPIPEGMFVCHRCDNPACVNPFHLFLGTAADNSSDMVVKGRQSKATKVTGESHGSAKLSEDQVLVIRSSDQTATHLAGRLGVNKSTINRIRQRKIWRHVP